MRATRKTFQEALFDILNHTFLILMALLCLYPLLHEVSLSFSSTEEALKGGFFFWPRQFTLAAYKSVFRNTGIFKAYGNSLFVTAVGTVISVLWTAATAYPLTKTKMPGKKFFMTFIIFTMLFGGGLIPSYLLIKAIGLVNRIWALIVPGAISAFNVFIMMSFFRTIPAEMEESAFMDGANPIKIFFALILPLSTPVLATVSLWEAVGNWNNFFGALIYLNDQDKFTLPLYVSQVISGATQTISEQVQQENSIETIIAATIILSVIPILCVYPFLQKYFAKGIMIGSVKG